MPRFQVKRLAMEECRARVLVDLEGIRRALLWNSRARQAQGQRHDGLFVQQPYRGDDRDSFQLQPSANIEC
ncbi:hypothetical protein SAMN02745775_11693 [Falsiroseomonas stagni DSM 19981]|uniref:Uncharacterized protein n=1 Tax=Falsiroseomonas stagni DSM 19981 TaxID=1123062 RepID=A0A1I4EI80_9PROT|nr:hypothetical protein SAMN02745775_11693 [Falsiroseomonas stagni DSM 19981]